MHSNKECKIFMDSCADHEILSEGAQLISDVFVVGGVVVLVNGGGGEREPNYH